MSLSPITHYHAARKALNALRYDALTPDQTRYTAQTVQNVGRHLLTCDGPDCRWSGVLLVLAARSYARLAASREFDADLEAQREWAEDGAVDFPWRWSAQLTAALEDEARELGWQARQRLEAWYLGRTPERTLEATHV